MTVRIHDTIYHIRHDSSAKLYYVDCDLQATSGATIEELLEKLRERYGATVLYSGSFE